MDIIQGIFVVLCVSVFICYGVISFNGYRNMRRADKLPVDALTEEVHCATCGVRLLKDSASVVKDYQVFFYCQSHKKPYDEISYGNLYKRMRVDINGEPIGYIKESATVEDLLEANGEEFGRLWEEKFGKSIGGDKLKAKKTKGKCK